jgi:hypothetical protein
VGLFTEIYRSTIQRCAGQISLALARYSVGNQRSTLTKEFAERSTVSDPQDLRSRQAGRHKDSQRDNRRGKCYSPATISLCPLPCARSTPTTESREADRGSGAPFRRLHLLNIFEGRHAKTFLANVARIKQFRVLLCRQRFIQPRLWVSRHSR